MAETAPIASGTGAAAEVTPSMSLSPPLSEKTVVAVVQAASPPPEPLAEPVPERASRPHKVDVQLPMPHLKLALFSTNGGQHDPRELTKPANYPPVIVHSNGMKDVVDFAAHWRRKLPNQYHCIFPGCGYHITDFWDAHDIHSETPQFLEEVLRFIQHENLHFARQYAVEWATKNRERLSVVAADDIYDPQNPISCVDKIFINGETETVPRPFLWHTANIMRMGMLNAAAQQQAAESAAKAGEAGKAVGSDGRKYDPKAKAEPVVEKKAIVAAEEMQPKPGPTPGSGPRKPWSSLLLYQGCVLTRAPEMLGQPPLAVPGSNQFPPENYPFLPRNAVLPPRPVPPPSTSIPMGPPVMPSPPGHPATVRNPKGRNAPQVSGSYGPYIGPWGRNSRQSSGGMPPMHVPPFQGPPPFEGPPPLGQQPIYPMTAGMPQFPPNTEMVPPPMPHNFLHMAGPAGAMHVPVMLGGPRLGHNIPSNFPPPCHLRGDMHMGDMTNSGRFPPDVNDSRMASRPNMNRRNSRLYNPYGDERPDFTSIPAQPNGRKGNRSSFSNGTGGVRNRKFSVGSQNPPNNFPYENYPVPPNAPRFNDHGRPAIAPSDLPINGEIDPTVVNDRVRGCGDGWIGPENDFVRQLIMFGLARGTNEHDIYDFFSRFGALPTHVNIHQDKGGHLLAHIT